ncbi:nucleoside-diphosphate-sugar epimerase family protein [Colletotrichum cuscutae]|uniref:Nucleoside-diphosphate-sugar epimerase family protein n=1 Tax=Colletotrichum cuscutae TaxID=1209917 RepID=A0AAI9XNM7_9PEZI|nr:nucleoside-diphosphate-sugar epimerase family protein [Colletotrichum cuscutae]
MLLNDSEPANFNGARQEPNKRIWPASQLTPKFYDNFLFKPTKTIQNNMSRAILITGATGKQGGAVISALLARQPSDFLLLAVTRNAQSTSAKRLAAKSSNIKLVEGDLDATPALFASAKAVAGTVPLWGVYSVQAMGDQKSDSETKQGKSLVDESIKAGIRHFVYSSVERGGNERSWSNPTPVLHFITKHL